MVTLFSWKRNMAEPAAPEPVAPPRDPAGELVRVGTLVELRVHLPEGREAFQRWYADPEIARLLRHDQAPLTSANSRAYFETIVLPSSQLGYCFAIHDVATGRLIGTTALTDIDPGPPRRSFFRIVIGEKEFWGAGRGTEATRLVVEEAFESIGLDEVRLEVFKHNPRAISAYERVGFEQRGYHVEWVGRERRELQVLEMHLRRERWRMVKVEGRGVDQEG